MPSRKTSSATEPDASAAPSRAGPPDRYAVGGDASGESGRKPQGGLAKRNPPGRRRDKRKCWDFRTVRSPRVIPDGRRSSGDPSLKEPARTSCCYPVRSHHSRHARCAPCIWVPITGPLNPPVMHNRKTSDATEPDAPAASCRAGPPDRYAVGGDAR